MFLFLLPPGLHGGSAADPEPDLVHVQRAATPLRPLASGGGLRNRGELNKGAHGDDNKG